MKYQLKRRVSVLCVYLARIQLRLLIKLSNIFNIYVCILCQYVKYKQKGITVIKVNFAHTRWFHGYCIDVACKLMLTAYFLVIKYTKRIWSLTCFGKHKSIIAWGMNMEYRYRSFSEMLTLIAAGKLSYISQFLFILSTKYKRTTNNKKK